MGQEPNNRMDDLLKGYAKQRRQQAGEPFAMHPATRRMLQDEVARTLGRRGARSQWDALRLWWPRLAFGGASVAIIAVAAVVVMQQAGRQPEPQQQDAHAALAPAGAPLQSGQKLDEMIAGQQQVAAAKAVAATAGERLAELRTDKLKEPKKTEEVEVAAAVLPPPATTPMPAIATAPASPPPAEAAHAGYGAQFRAVTAGVENMARASQRMRFAQAASTGGAGAKDQLQAGQEVLASFQLEQSGDRVVIVDADGSTYEGQLQLAQPAPLQHNVEFGRRMAATEAAPAPAPTQEPAKAAPVTVTARSSGRPAGASVAEQPQQAQPLFFTATGTNRSLRQRVVINGTLDLDRAAPGSDAAVAGQPMMPGAAVADPSNTPAPAAAAPASTATSALSPQSRARVQGTFRVGDAPAVRLDAVGVEP